MPPTDPDDDPDDDEPAYCTSCEGTGEGQYDGARCMSCRGHGFLRPTREESDDYDQSTRDFPGV